MSRLRQWRQQSDGKIMSWLSMLLAVAAALIAGSVLYYLVEAVRLARGANEPEDGTAR